MKPTIFLLACLVFLGAFQFSDTPAYACGGWWDPCCKWWAPDQNCPNARPDLEAVSQAAKDRATLWSAGLMSARIYSRAFTAVHSVGCVALVIPSCGWAMVGAGASRGLTIGKDWADWYSRDPFDENYLYPYEAQLYDAAALDLPECAADGSWEGDAFCRYMVDHARYIYGFWEMAYVSANRAASCAWVNNENCFRWQKERISAAIRQAGLHTEYLAYGLAVASDVTGSQEARDAANAVYEVAFSMEDNGND